MSSRRMPRRKPRRLLRRLLVAGVVVALLPALPLLAWRWLPPPTTSFILRESGPVKRQWVDAEALSPWLAIAVVASEDQLFPVHRGFDTASMRQAIDDHLGGRRSRGASTISQQLAKNLFLWPRQSLLRKGLEAWLTVHIELLWSKQRILEVYLNVAEFGPGLFGAEAASRHYFGVAAVDLSAEQAARLAAVLPSPKRYDAGAPTPYLRQRVAWIQRQMRQLGGPGYLAACCPQLARPP